MEVQSLTNSLPTGAAKRRRSEVLTEPIPEPSVIDASPVLADLLSEAGATLARTFLPLGMMTSVNYSEVISKLIDKGLAASLATETVENLGLSVVQCDLAMATLAGQLRAFTRHLGLSLGDRFAVALAIQTGLPLLTSDRRWQELQLGVRVILIR